MNLRGVGGGEIGTDTNVFLKSIGKTYLSEEQDKEKKRTTEKIIDWYLARRTQPMGGIDLLKSLAWNTNKCMTSVG